MVVGLCELAVALPGNRSLKEKRRVVRGLIDRLRARHRISVAEVADNDDHERGVIGFAVVGSDRTRVRAVLDDVLRTVDETCPADVVTRDLEVEDW